jgi:S1-C subfamily serine protease
MTEALRGFSDALAGVVENAGASVVRVDARRRLPATGIVWSADGVIVTAHHVVRRDENIEVGLPDGSTVAAEFVGRDPTTDLAVLRADASGLTVPAWAGPEALRVGHFVLALGRPGQTVQATLGIVSALSEGSWRTPAGGAMDRYLQTDVVMYPGFSGGPLASTSGQVVGLNTSHLLRGHSVAVPFPTIDEVAGTLLEHGRIRRGYLGIGAQPARLPEGLGEELGQETGLLLVSVESDSPAGQAGLAMGDTIVTFDGQPVRHLDDLLGLLSGDRVGAEVPVRILRGGKLMEVSVVIGERD